MASAYFGTHRRGDFVSGGVRFGIWLRAVLLHDQTHGGGAGGVDYARHTGIALLLGHGLNGEVVPPSVWLGAACIGLGLSLHQWGARWLRRVTA